MNPFGLLAVAAAAGAGYYFYEKNKKAKPSAPAHGGGYASELEKGKPYTVQAVITKEIGSNNALTVGHVIKSTFEQLGAKVISPVSVKGEDDMKKFLAGEPSTWIFNIVWNHDAKQVGEAPAWLAGASFLKLPMTALP